MNKHNSQTDHNLSHEALFKQFRFIIPNKCIRSSKSQMRPLLAMKIHSSWAYSFIVLALKFESSLSPPTMSRSKAQLNPVLPNKPPSSHPDTPANGDPLTPLKALLFIVKPFINCKQKCYSQCQHQFNNLILSKSHLRQAHEWLPDDGIGSNFPQGHV